VVGCGGFLSFSLVFCLLGGRFETTLYIHFTRRWVKSSAILRRLAKAKTRKKAEENAVLRSWRLCRGGVVSRAGSVDGLRLPHILNKPPLA